MRFPLIQRLAPCFTVLALLQACASVLSATRDDDRATLARLLRAGEDPNQASGNDVTPLFEAIEQRNLPLVRLLVEGGANVNQLSRCHGDRVPPLHKAVLHNSLPLVQYLLAKGADATTLPGGTGIFLFMAFSRDAVDSGRMAEAILSHIEAKSGRDTMLQIINRQASNGWTPLAAAAHAGDLALVQALLARGAAVDLLARASNADWRSRDEWPAFHFAAVRGYEAIMDRLVAAGANPNQRSRDGATSSEIIAALDQRRIEEATQRRRQERADAERSAAMYQAFTSSLGYAPAAPISNPLDDDSFQRKMQALANSSRRPAPSPPEEPVDEETSSVASSSASNSVAAASSVVAGVSLDGPPSASAVAGSDGEESGEAEANAAAEAAQQEEARKQEEALKQEEARKQEEVRQQEAARKQEEERQRVEQEKTNKEAQAAAEREAAQRAHAAYLTAMRQGIRLRATKCPDGEGHYYVIGHKPSGTGGCIDVYYRASCPGNAVSSGVARNFVGNAGCFGDTYQIAPKLPCSVDQVSVTVTDVQSGCN